jgi:hypothetical protein
MPNLRRLPMPMLPPNLNISLGIHRSYALCKAITLRAVVICVTFCVEKCQEMPRHSPLTSFHIQIDWRILPFKILNVFLISVFLEYFIKILNEQFFNINLSIDYDCVSSLHIETNFKANHTIFASYLIEVSKFMFNVIIDDELAIWIWNKYMWVAN